MIHCLKFLFLTLFTGAFSAGFTTQELTEKEVIRFYIGQVLLENNMFTSGDQTWLNSYLQGKHYSEYCRQLILHSVPERYAEILEILHAAETLAVTDEVLLKHYLEANEYQAYARKALSLPEVPKMINAIDFVYQDLAKRINFPQSSGQPVFSEVSQEIQMLEEYQKAKDYKNFYSKLIYLYRHYSPQ